MTKAPSVSAICEIYNNTGDYVIVNGDPTSMQNAVAIKPNTVAIQADTTYFQTYTSGIMSGTACGDGKLVNHNAVIVGYGTSGSTPYWLVRNSWGTGWGESGYFQV